MKKLQVAVVGINSIFGGTSALLLKQSRFIKCLKLYDQRNLEAAVDLCAINTPCKVKMFLGNDQLESAFEGADIIVISDEGNDAIMSLDSHLMTKAGNYKTYASAIARASPNAIIVVASTPINCLLPIMSQLLAKQGCYNHNKVLGSTLVDTMRASSMLASHLNLDPKEVVLPVIGGSSEQTRVPVFSQSRPFFTLKKDEKTNLIMNIRQSDVQVLANKGSPEVLNRAYSTVRFLNSIMAGLRGDPNVTDITLCRTDQVPGVDYFSLPVIFGKDGIIKRFGVPKTTEAEDEMVEEAIKHVKKDTDKAAYIARGAIELPDKKYLSANERASSQKEMFDLYVKSLPKPLDNKHRDLISDNNSQKSTNYSFKKLLKDEPSINPVAVPESKSFRSMACNRLKNVGSDDRFLKTTGYFTGSSLQNPILILEPMGFPLAPQDLDKHSKLEESEGGEFEAEDNMLHENILTKTRKGQKVSLNNVEGPKVSMRPTRKSPLCSNERVQKKTIDPIAKLKDHVADRFSHKEVHIHPVRKAILSELSSGQANHKANEDYSDQHNPDETVGFNAERQPPSYRSNRKDEFLEEKKVSSKKDNFAGLETKCNSNLNDEGDPERTVRKFVYDFKSDRALPVNRVSKHNLPTSYPTEKENGEWQEVVSDEAKSLNPDTEEKYRKLVNRIFTKLDGLKDGTYLPMKPSDRTKSRCMQSFTESAVRSKSHWTSTGNLFPSKPQEKEKMNESPFEVEQDVNDNYYQKNLCFKKARKPVPRIKSFLSQSTTSTASRSYSKRQSIPENFENTVIEQKQETVHVVCPKCQNKISCYPDKNVKTNEHKPPKRCEESNTETKVNPGEKKVNVSYYGPRPDNSMTHYDCEGVNLTSTSQPTLHSLMTPSKTPLETELQDERLRKLKEKINQKLIPLLNRSELPNANHSSVIGNSRTISISTPNCSEPNQKSCKTSNLKDSHLHVGTPFVVGKAEVSREKNDRNLKNVGETKKTEASWQGIPFVVKLENEKAERKLKEEVSRTAGLKKNEKKIHSQEADEQMSAKCSIIFNEANKRATKTTNKLQLLSSSSELNTKPEIKEKISELLESEKTFRDTKQTLSKKEKLDLNGENVQCYMQTRMKNMFERRQQLTGNKDADKDTKISDMFDEMTRKNRSKNYNNSSMAEVQTSQAIQLVTDLGLNQVPSADKKIDEATEPECSENNNNCNVKSCSVEAVKQSSINIAVGEVSLKTEEEEQTRVVIPPPTRNSCLKPDMAEPVDHGTGIIITQTLNQNKGASANDQNDTKNQSPKILRTSLVNSRSDLQSKQNPLLQMIVSVPKSANKLQLLTKTREMKLNNRDKNSSVNVRLQNMWEQTLNVKANSAVWNEKKFSSKGRKNIFGGILGRTSAAVKIAKNYSMSKPPTYKVKLTPPAINNTNILDGFTFPCRKARRKSIHNKLKKLTSSASLRKSRQNTQSIPKKPVRRGRSLDPGNEIHLYMQESKGKERGFPSFSENLGSFEMRSAEYSRVEDRFAKLASEMMMKRQLIRPRTEGGKWKLGGSEEKIYIQKQQRPSSYSSVQNLREQRADYGIRKDNKLKPRIRKSVDDVPGKLISMPQVRHQIEHSEMPLGPLEVQPGLAPLNYGKSGPKFPSADNSWEFVLYNEYVRSNLLPSLKDTRETFHLEERPS